MQLTPLPLSATVQTPNFAFHNQDVGVGEVSICAVDATRALCIVNHEAGARMVLATWQPDTHTYVFRGNMVIGTSMRGRGAFLSQANLLHNTRQIV